MERYEYKTETGITFRSHERADWLWFTNMDEYGNKIYKPAKRVWGFSFKPTMKEHINSTTGQYVRTEQQFNTQLKRMSESASIRTGIEHDFQPVDISTPTSNGVTEQGLYEQSKNRYDQQIPNEGRLV